MTRENQFKERLIKYMEIEAMSRYEEPVVNELKKELANEGFKFSRDNFGCLIMHKPSKNPNAPKVLLAAHMDEVGYVVRNFDKKDNYIYQQLVVYDHVQLLEPKQN